MPVTHGKIAAVFCVECARDSSWTLSISISFQLAYT